MSEDQSIKESVFKIGEVISVKGRNIEVKVDKNKNTSHILYKGELLKNVSVGSYVKIIKGFTKIIGKIEGEFIDENEFYLIKDYVSKKERIIRILNVSLLGFFNVNNFERGIKELPLIGNECYLLDKKEFDSIHHFTESKDLPISFGTLSLEEGQKIDVGINSLFASHIGIFGNTGSGKSYTLAKIYRELFLQFKNSKNFTKNSSFLLFDFSGEYSNGKSIIEDKKVFNLSTKIEKDKINENNKIPISENDLIDIDLISILANATEKTQRPFISRSLDFYKTVQSNVDPINYFRNILKKRIKEILRMTDKEKAFLLIDYARNIIGIPGNNVLDDLYSEIEWNNKFGYFMKRGSNPCHELTENEIEQTIIYITANNYEFPDDVLSKVIHFLYLQIIFDVYNDRAENEHISPAINKLKSKCKDLEKVLDTNKNGRSIFEKNNFTVINLNDVNITMKKTLPLLISKKVYSEQKQKHIDDEKKFLNIIIDEAHNILSEESYREDENWRDYRLETFEEIIKEGRKFGVFLTIASQRPHDISPTIISQLHNYFLHRLINNLDLLAIEKTISYLDKVSLDYLSILPTGTCVFTGLSAQIPVIITIDRILPEEYEPNNKTIDLVNSWGKSKQKEL